MRSIIVELQTYNESVTYSIINTFETFKNLQIKSFYIQRTPRKICRFICKIVFFFLGTFYLFSDYYLFVHHHMLAILVGSVDDVIISYLWKISFLNLFLSFTHTHTLFTENMLTCISCYFVSCFKFDNRQKHNH